MAEAQEAVANIQVWPVENIENRWRKFCNLKCRSVIISCVYRKVTVVAIIILLLYLSYIPNFFH